MQTPMTSADVRQLAVDGGKLIRTIAPMINDLKIVRGERNDLAITLFASSLHHGQAICALIETERPQFAASAFTLFRAQQEQFLRGAFFAQHASDDQLAYFKRKNKLPKKHEGEELTTTKLAEMVDRTIPKPSDSFATSFTKSWSALCGYVHGGTEILDMYLTESGIRSELEVDRAAKIVSRAVSQAMITLVVMSRLGDPKQPSFRAPFESAYSECIRIARVCGIKIER